MHIVNELAQQYAEKYTTPEEEILKEMVAYTVTNHSEPHMLSGHLQGQLLQMISSMISPRRILEIGTFTGYSAICLAKGLTGDGILHTIEIREKEAAAARYFFEKSYVREKIKIHIGDARQKIDELDETWDLVFLDADKVNYINYFTAVFPKVRKNGFILADNVLFHGQVLEEKVKGKNALAIQAFNDFVNGRTDVEKVMLPLRDGLYLIKKLS